MELGGFSAGFRQWTAQLAAIFGGCSDVLFLLESWKDEQAPLKKETEKYLLMIMMMMMMMMMLVMMMMMMMIMMMMSIIIVIDW